MKSLAAKLKPGPSLLLGPCDNPCEIGLKQPGTQATIILHSNFFSSCLFLIGKEEEKSRALWDCLMRNSVFSALQWFPSLILLGHIYT